MALRLDVLTKAVADIAGGLKSHVDSCAADAKENNRRLGNRVWAVCAIIVGTIVGSIGSVSVYYATQVPAAQRGVEAQQAAQTAAIIQAIDQLKK